MGYWSEKLFEKCINILIFSTDYLFKSVAVLWLLPPTKEVTYLLLLTTCPLKEAVIKSCWELLGSNSEKFAQSSYENAYDRIWFLFSNATGGWQFYQNRTPYFNESSKWPFTKITQSDSLTQLKSYYEVYRTNCYPGRRWQSTIGSFDWYKPFAWA